MGPTPSQWQSQHSDIGGPDDRTSKETTRPDEMLAYHLTVYDPRAQVPGGPLRVSISKYDIAEHRKQPITGDVDLLG